MRIALKRSVGLGAAALAASCAAILGISGPAGAVGPPPPPPLPYSATNANLWININQGEGLALNQCIIDARDNGHIDTAQQYCDQISTAGVVSTIEAASILVQPWGKPAVAWPNPTHPGLVDIDVSNGVVGQAVNQCIIDSRNGTIDYALQACRQVAIAGNAIFLTGSSVTVREQPPTPPLPLSVTDANVWIDINQGEGLALNQCIIDARDGHINTAQQYCDQIATTGEVSQIEDAHVVVEVGLLHPYEWFNVTVDVSNGLVGEAINQCIIDSRNGTIDYALQQCRQVATVGNAVYLTGSTVTVS